MSHGFDAASAGAGLEAPRPRRMPGALGIVARIAAVDQRS